MVTVTEVKETFNSQELPTDDTLREERRRTGRYVATVIAIFVSLFGLYQAMARGTPEYAAFFLPALIMFLYVLWILYASRARGKHSNELQETNTSEDTNILPEKPPETDTTRNVTSPKPSTSQGIHSFSRSYSIA